MTLDFSTKQQLKILTFEYVNDILAARGKAPKLDSDGFVLVKGKNTAAPEDLFKVDEDATK